MPKPLSIDKPLDNHLKPVKDSDGTMSAMELSADKVRVKGLDILGAATGQAPTTGDGLATKGYVDDNSGGTAYWMQVWSARLYTRYDNWYIPNAQYGVGYYNWSSGVGSSMLSVYADSSNPSICVPKNCTLTEYTYTGNFQTSQTYQFALQKGTHPTFGSAGDYSLSQIGATQEVASATANILYEVGQTGLSVSLNKGDILIPTWRRTTEDTSTYRYLEMAFSIVCEIS
tara:strand:- start:2256 stop:2942 length:687 start_codon:yes stop_codon:yes gene_type:complete